jgi:lysophospholipase L1-like esterase
MQDYRRLRAMPRWRKVLAPLLCVLLAACTAGAGVATRESTDMRYLALGDSYTIGEGVAPAERWPVQLARALREEGVRMPDPRIIATTGWTTDELSSALDMEEPLGSWQFVSLLIGVNNQYRGRTVTDYRAEFEALLERAIGYAGGRADRVVVLSIPDWGVTPFARAQDRDAGKIAAELDAYNAAAREISERHGVAFVDVTALSRAYGDEPAMLVDDGLHPSGSMYRLWTEATLPVARRLLSR